MQYQNTASYPSNSWSSREELPNDIDYRSILMMDRSFAPTRFLKTAQDLFFKVQGAWNREDRAILSALCGSELMQSWEAELSGLKAQGHKNRMVNIALRDGEIPKLGQKAGRTSSRFSCTPTF